MNVYPVSVPFLFLCFLIRFTSCCNSPSHLAGDVSINCGSTGTFAARNGRVWIGDVVVVKPKSTSLLEIQGSSTTSTVDHHHHHKLISGDPVPHKTARISRSRFSYAFRVKPGQIILRLHFNPATYKGFKGLKDLFTVEAGPFILLGNFSASLTADGLGLNSFSREFCLDTRENEQLNVTFSPESHDAYAFINGIEIISVPTSVSYFQGEDIGVQAVGHESLVYVDRHAALEIVHRLDAKQQRSVSGDFDGMFPKWATQKSEKLKNNTWKVAVDVGFRYLIRFHFSEMGLKIAGTAEMVFQIFINEVVAFTNTEIVKRKDENSIPRYRDFLATMRGQRKEGKRDISISLHELTDGQGLVAGFEIFKLTNPDNSLASPNPVPPARGSTSNSVRILLSFLGHRNVFASVAIAIVSLLNIIVHKLREYLEANSPKVENKPSARAQRLCRRFSLAEIQLVTRNFSDAFLIGRGGFGKVYKGNIDKGQTTVAVKRLKSNSSQGAREFLMEIETLSELRHVNLVSLIGYCNEHGEMILVYEYMAGGTLADQLYKLSRLSNNNSCSLTWAQRLNICIGAGRGLDYLHTGHGVIHRDVKTSNILLDESFVAKVSDFGLAKHEDGSNLQSHISTKVKGTNGYLDPHYFYTRKLTRKTDTYAFGVVLLEILCGRPAVDLRIPEDEQILSKWAREKISKGETDQIVDSGLRDEISPDSLKTFVGVAERCLRDEPKNRPTMSQVVLQLEFALEQQENRQVMLLNPRNIEIGVSINTGKPRRASTEVQNMMFQMDVASPEAPFIRRDGRKPTVHKPLRIWTWDSFWNRLKPTKRNDLLLAEIREELYDANIKLTEFDWDTIAAATGRFSPSKEVGEGGYGPVYKGVLSTGQVVAVKRLSPFNKQGNREFKNEILFLPKLQHRNIISLLGYCIHGEEEKLLVYEFMENTSLNCFIFGKARQPLQWGVCFKIMTGIAQAVVYLHQDFRPRVVHRDLKASKILLDSEMNPKISDFALARTLAEHQSELETMRLVGAYGYMSPEYAKYGKFSVKSDVYSFGIIVLEIVSGRRMHGSHPDSMISLLEYACKLWNEERALDLVDGSLVGAFPEEEALRCIQVGLLCTQLEPNHRPNMPSVLKMLQGEEIPAKLQQTKTFQEICEEICGANINFTKFDWDTVAAATNQFSPSNKVGRGAFCSVYKGVLPTGQVAAVKMLSLHSTQGLMEFKNETLLLPKLQHPNIIKLLGYCIHGEKKLLVYEFLENASVDAFCFGEGQGGQCLPWPVRFKIITGIARGVVYLHQDSGLRLIFRNLHPSNILLDSEMNPKITNFGSARTMVEDQSEMETSNIEGNLGYMSPEHAMQGTFSVKTDVYSFGIMVLEIVRGRKLIAQNWESITSPLDDAWTLQNEGKALDLVDESIRGPLSEDEALRCIQVGLLCTQFEPQHRPTMASVLAMLLGEEDVSLKITEAASHRNETL